MKPIVLPELSLTDKHMRRSIAFILDEQSVAAWCLGLTLLDRDLVTELEVQDAAGSSVLLKRDPKIKPGDQGIVHWNPPVPTLILAETALGSWLYFSLRYYRDGVGDVSHIDSELQSDPPEDGITDVIIVVPNSRPGLTREELDKLMEELDKLEYDD